MTQQTNPNTSPDLGAICQKEIWSAKECATYVGISLSTLYKWMFNRQIPYFKPCGKLAFFKRVEVEKWLQTNRYATQQEIEVKANEHIQTKKGGNQ